jgi:hypothetical protein
MILTARAGIVNSPTLETRRIMIASYYYNIAILLFILGIFVILFTFFLSTIRENEVWTFWVKGSYQITLCAIPVYFFIVSFWTNIKWNNSLRNSFRVKEQINSDAKSNSSIATVHLPYFMAIGSVFFAFFPASIYYIFYYNGFGRLMPYVPPLILLFIVFILFCFHKFIALPLIKDHSSLFRTPSKINDIYAVLIGKEKISTFNERINFCGDLILVWSIFFIVQGIVCRNYFDPTIQHEVVRTTTILVFSFSFLTLITFTLFFAGIPRKRYWGFIFVGFILLIIDIVYFYFTKSLHLFPEPTIQFLPHVILPVNLLLSLIVAGISGLSIFKLR